MSGITNATQVSAGGLHTCALLSDQTVKCWGYNGDGELGDGVTNHGATDFQGLDTSPTPVTVSGITNATQISAGGQHTCALLSGGTVVCWGDNWAGQLGNGTTTDSPTPVRVSGITNATQISAGFSHTCALLSDGTVMCWGWNWEGQLGNGTTTENSPTPVQVSGITNATQISAGSDHTCALLTGGTVRCWGDNLYGWLGNGTTTNSPTPVPVSGVSTATQVTAGGMHTCALLSGGAIKCWGHNVYGELGNGNYDDHSVPLDDSSIPVSVSGISTATQVTAGGFHTCALISGGAIKCWGDGEDGELGNGAYDASPTPVPVSGISIATQVSASCALLSDHTVKCWGPSNSGQLGNGELGHMSAIPVDVVGLP